MRGTLTLCAALVPHLLRDAPRTPLACAAVLTLATGALPLLLGARPGPPGGRPRPRGGGGAR
ncbi:hypothetical protein, partial [Streptomyces sp. NPDC002490]|uniref:hypothetical protein n=1 Tax=Streptomyces sp. NPDC002490 TaxID=3154416 RepID=UPI00331CED7F